MATLTGHGIAGEMADKVALARGCFKKIFIFPLLTDLRNIISTGEPISYI